jgi:hypothetical protein
MRIRPMVLNDLERIQEIHNRHFKNEFEMPDFSKFIGLFVVEDDQSQIVVGGGVRPIAEAVILTDKDADIMLRVRALHKTLDISEYLTRSSGFDALHAYVTDENWFRQLEGKGFVPTRGKSLVLNL